MAGALQGGRLSGERKEAELSSRNLEHVNNVGKQIPSGTVKKKKKKVSRFSSSSDMVANIWTVSFPERLGKRTMFVTRFPPCVLLAEQSVKQM